MVNTMGKGNHGTKAVQIRLCVYVSVCVFAAV